MEIETDGLIACPDCDLLQRKPRHARGTVRCARCDAALFRATPHALDMALPLMLAAALLYLVALASPIMTLALYGRETTATLAGLAGAFHAAGMTSVGAVVLVTLVLIPGLEIFALLWLLLPLRLGTAPRAFGPVSRLLQGLRPWSMIEVFVLAALVSIGRLGELAHLQLQPAFWALVGMMFLIAAADSVFDERAYWMAGTRGAAA